ncbi:MAG: hypothetical protein AB7P23_08255 [Amphiplicatus sp.]
MRLGAFRRRRLIGRLIGRLRVRKAARYGKRDNQAGEESHFHDKISALRENPLGQSHRPALSYRRSEICGRRRSNASGRRKFNFFDSYTDTPHGD